MSDATIERPVSGRLLCVDHLGNLNVWIWPAGDPLPSGSVEGHFVTLNCLW
jgi:hypothetical protein